MPDKESTSSHGPERIDRDLEGKEDLEPEELIGQLADDMSAQAENFSQDVGRENPDLSLKAERAAAMHIAKIKATLETLRTEVEKLGEKKELGIITRELLEERNKRRDELLADSVGDYDFTNDADYIFLNEQHKVYEKLLDQLNDGLDEDQEIAARAEANEKLRRIHIEKKIDELNDLLLELQEIDKDAAVEEINQALEKATNIINDERYNEAKFSILEDDEADDFEVPESIEEASMVAKQMIEQLSHLRDVADGDWDEEEEEEEEVDDFEDEESDEIQDLSDMNYDELRSGYFSLEGKRLQKLMFAKTAGFDESSAKDLQEVREEAIAYLEEMLRKMPEENLRLFLSGEVGKLDANMAAHEKAEQAGNLNNTRYSKEQFDNSNAVVEAIKKIASERGIDVEPEQSELGLSDTALNDLLYADVKPENKDVEYAPEFIEVANKYAEKLEELRNNPDFDKIVDEIRTKFEESAKRLGLKMSDYAKSQTWILWDLAKQKYMFDNPDEQDEKYRIADPMEDEELRDQIVSRHLGWEFQQKYGYKDSDFENIDKDKDSYKKIKEILETSGVKENGTFSSSDLTKLGALLRDNLGIEKVSIPENEEIVEGDIEEAEVEEIADAEAKRRGLSKSAEDIVNGNAEDAEFTEVVELDVARKNYFAALQEKKKTFSTKRFLGIGKYNKKAELEFEKLKHQYELALQTERKEKLENKKAELLATAESGGEIPKQLFEEYLTLLQDEDNKIDDLISSQEKSQFQKFQGWWRKHSKARLVAGLALGGVGVAASMTGLGAVAGGTLFGASFALVRGATSGVGTYMTAEAFMDRNTKLGQKGLIDKAARVDLATKAETLKETKVSRGDKWWKLKLEVSDAHKKVVDRLMQELDEKGENVFDGYELDEIALELSRLRAVSLEKGVKLSEAGRFGNAQADLVTLLQEAYHKKLREGLQEEADPLMDDKAKLDKLSEMMDREFQQVQNDLVTDVGNERGKRIVRHSLAAGLGLTMGMVSGSRMLEKFAGKPDNIEAPSPDVADNVQDTSDGFSSAPAEGTAAILDTDNIETTPADSLGREIFSADADTSVVENTTDVPVEHTPRPPLFVENNDKPDSLSGAFSDSTEVAHHTTSPDSSMQMSSAPAESLAPNREMMEEITTVRHTENIPKIEHINFASTVEVAKGDTVWGIAKGELIKRIGEEKWSELGEARQTYLIDAIKDKIVANPAEYGIDGDVDVLHVGDSIDIGKAFEGSNILEGLQQNAENLSPEQIQNIVLNNEAIAKAAKAGVKIATENVDKVAAEVREHGLGFLTKDGQIHEWSMNGNPIDKVGDHFVSAVSGEQISPDRLSEVLDHAGEKAMETVPAETVADAAETVASATEEVREFSDQALQEIMSQNDPNHIEEYISDYVSDKGWPADKVKVFLSSLRDSDGHIRNDLGGVLHGDPTQMANSDLDNVLKYFDDIAVKNSFQALDQVDSGHWSPVNIGNKFYFVMKEHSGHWPLRSDSWLIDRDGDLRSDGFVKFNGGQMRQAFTSGSIDNLQQMDVAPDVSDTTDNFQEIGGVTEGAEGSGINEVTPEEEAVIETSEPTVATPEAEPANIEQGSAEFHNTRINEVQSAMNRMKEAGIFSENLSVEDIEKINDKELLEKMKQVLDDSISEQEAATIGTEQGVDRGDLVALGAVEDRLYQLELETPSADFVEADTVPTDTLPEAEPVEEITDLENVAESSPLENGAFNTPEGHTAQFEYDTDGKVNSVRVSGNLSGQPELLNEDFRAKVMEAWEKSGRKGNIQLNIDKVTMTARNLQLQNEILENMESAGLGETPEAKFLKSMIDSRIATTEKFYGDVFKE